MKFKQLMDMYDNWYKDIRVNDDNLDVIVSGVAINVMDCMENFNPMTKVKSYEELFDMEVVSFGFYDDEFCVRVK